MVINIFTIVFAIAAKWVILGRMRPGRYPLWGAYYYRWWLVQRLTALTHPKWFQGSPLMRLFMIAMGAKVGLDAIVGDHEAGALDLVEIGPRASVGGKVKFANARVEGAEFIVGRITHRRRRLRGHVLRARRGRLHRRREPNSGTSAPSRPTPSSDPTRSGTGRRRAAPGSPTPPSATPIRRPPCAAARCSASATWRCCWSSRRSVSCRSSRPSGCSISSTTGCRSRTWTASPIWRRCRCWPGRPPSSWC